MIEIIHRDPLGSNTVSPPGKDGVDLPPMLMDSLLTKTWPDRTFHFPDHRNWFREGHGMQSRQMATLSWTSYKWKFPLLESLQLRWYNINIELLLTILSLWGRSWLENKDSPEENEAERGRNLFFIIFLSILIRHSQGQHSTTIFSYLAHTFCTFLCFCLKQFLIKISITWSRKNPNILSLWYLMWVPCFFSPLLPFSSLSTQVYPNLNKKTKNHSLSIKDQENVLFFNNVFYPRLSLGSQHGNIREESFLQLFIAA